MSLSPLSISWTLCNEVHLASAALPGYDSSKLIEFMKRIMKEHCNYLCLRETMIYLIFMQDTLVGILITRHSDITVIMQQQNLDKYFSHFPYWFQIRLSKRKNCLQSRDDHIFCWGEIFGSSSGLPLHFSSYAVQGILNYADFCTKVLTHI